MKPLLPWLCLILLSASCTNPSTESKTTSIESNEVENMMAKLRHVVLFKFKETTSPADIKKVEIAFANLPKQIPEIKGFEWGWNNSPERLNKEFTHCFFLTFNSENDRDIYLPHPAHKAFGEMLSQHLDDVLVVDYWAN